MPIFLQRVLGRPHCRGCSPICHPCGDIHIIQICNSMSSGGYFKVFWERNESFLKAKVHDIISTWKETKLLEGYSHENIKNIQTDCKKTGDPGFALKSFEAPSLRTFENMLLQHRIQIFFALFILTLRSKTHPLPCFH